MKIAIPSETADQLQSIRSGHFGHTPYFTIVEYDDDMNIVSTEAVNKSVFALFRADESELLSSRTALAVLSAFLNTA